MIDEGRGVPRVLVLSQSSGVGGDTTLDIRPPAGEIWDLIACRSSTDDANRDGAWYAYDVDSGPLQNVIFSWTAGNTRTLYTDVSGMMRPIRLTNMCYLQVKYFAMAAARTITGKLYLERITGVPFYYLGT